MCCVCVLCVCVGVACACCIHLYECMHVCMSFSHTYIHTYNCMAGICHFPIIYIHTNLLQVNVFSHTYIHTYINVWQVLEKGEDARAVAHLNGRTFHNRERDVYTATHCNTLQHTATHISTAARFTTEKERNKET